LQQVVLPSGSVQRNGPLAPLRVVGEREVQLTWSHLSRLVAPFAPPAFTGFPATQRRSDFSPSINLRSWPRRRFTACADSARPPKVRCERDPLRCPNSPPATSDDRASRTRARWPRPDGLTGLHFRSALWFFFGFHPTHPCGRGSRQIKSPLAQLPSARSCHHQTPRGTSTPNRSPMV
jgi:hypothetical protein